MATRTLTGTTAWRDSGHVVSQNLWTNVGTATTGLNTINDGAHITKASSTAVGTGIGSDYLQVYGMRLGLLDPRGGLPAGYSNFQITSIQVDLYDKLDITSIAGGQVIAYLNCRLFYNNDTWWSTPRFTPGVFTFGSSPRNTLAWHGPVTFSAAGINGSATVGTSGVTAANSLSPTQVFEGTLASEILGPMCMITMHINTGTKVGTWTVDGLRVRVNYSYDIPVSDATGASSGARHFFDCQ